MAGELLGVSSRGRGAAKHWEAMCRHMLLSIQLSEAVAEATEAKQVERKERKGLEGEDDPEREGEPTPAFPGSELSPQRGP